MSTMNRCIFLLLVMLPALKLQAQPIGTTGPVQQTNVTPQQFGAIADDALDDAAAIDSAISYASTRGLPVVFPPGTYVVSRLIGLQPTNTLIGTPGKSIIEASGSSPGDEFTLFRRSGATLEIYMEGLRLVHNGQVSGTPSFTNSNGVEGNQLIKAVIRNCEFVDFPNAAISFGREAASAQGDIEVSGCRFWTEESGLIGALGVDCDSCRSLIVSNCIFRKIARGVSIEPAQGSYHDIKDVVVSGNVFLDGEVATLSSTNSCIPIMFNTDTGRSIDNVTITGNIVENCDNTSASQGYAIMIAGRNTGRPIQNVSCTGNVVRNWGGGSSSHVFLFRNATNVAFTNNVSQDPDWRDVFVSSINDSTETFTAVAHGIDDDDVVYLTTTNTFPTPLATDTRYYAIVGGDPDTFQLETSIGGGAIDITGTETLTVHDNLEAGLFVQGDVSQSVIANNIWRGGYDPAVIQISGTNSDIVVRDNRGPLGFPFQLSTATGFTIHHTGSGDPTSGISTIAADVGSTYHRTDGGAGTSIYVKESGTGSSGWVGK